MIMSEELFLHPGVPLGPSLLNIYMESVQNKLEWLAGVGQMS